MRNLVRMIGLFTFITGVGLVVVAGLDFVKAVVTDAQVRYDWFFYIGILVLIIGWWFLLAGYGGVARARYVDCQVCGVPNDVEADRCRGCGELIT